MWQAHSLYARLGCSPMLGARRISSDLALRLALPSLSPDRKLKMLGPFVSVLAGFALIFVYGAVSPYEAAYNGLWFVDMGLLFSSAASFLVCGGWVLGKLM